jgi:hypothetical protein
VFNSDIETEPLLLNGESVVKIISQDVKEKNPNIVIKDAYLQHMNLQIYHKNGNLYFKSQLPGMYNQDNYNTPSAYY